MSGAWDFVIKQLLESNTQQFVSWLVEDGLFVETLSVDLKRRSIYADALYKVSLYDESMLLHIELQSRADPRMAERLLEYSVQASRIHDFLPVLSTVIYLREGKNISEPPLISKLPGGRKVLHFEYDSIKLWEIESRTILDTHLPGLLPLLTLTKDGQRMDVVDTMIEQIGPPAEHKELLAIAYTIAGLVFKGDDNQQALKRRFAVLDEILQDSWTYQEIRQKAMEQGLEQGLEQGREQGRELGLEQGMEVTNQKWLTSQRAFLTNAIKKRFPALLTLAIEKSQQVRDPEILEQANTQLFDALTQSEAEDILAHLHV